MARQPELHNGDHRHDDHHHDGHVERHHEHDHAAHDSHTHRRGLRGLLVSLVSPHDHGPSADRQLESTSEGIRAVFVSLAALALTATIQLVVALFSHSVALLADTIHNFADALTAVPLALAFRVGRRPPTRRYTYGFGRAEDLAGIAIVALIAGSTVIAAYEAIKGLVHPQVINGPGWVAAAGVVGVVGNELVAGYRVRVGRRIGSAALVADGLHARSDGLTSLAVVVGAIAVAAGARRADAIVALLITGAITVVLCSAVRTIYRRLMDSVDPLLVDQVETVLRESPGVDAVESVRIRWVGHELLAEIQIVSDSALSLVDAHAIAEEAHHRLLHLVPRLAEAVIHTSPAEGGARRYHDVVGHHFPERAPAAEPTPSAGSTPSPRREPGRVRHAHSDRSGS